MQLCSNKTLFCKQAALLWAMVCQFNLEHWNFSQTCSYPERVPTDSEKVWQPM